MVKNKWIGLWIVMILLVSTMIIAADEEEFSVTDADDTLQELRERVLEERNKKIDEMIKQVDEVLEESYGIGVRPVSLKVSGLMSYDGDNGYLEIDGGVFCLKHPKVLTKEEIENKIEEEKECKDYTGKDKTFTFTYDGDKYKLIGRELYLIDDGKEDDDDKFLSHVPPTHALHRNTFSSLLGRNPTIADINDVIEDLSYVGTEDPDVRERVNIMEQQVKPLMQEIREVSSEKDIEYEDAQSKIDSVAKKYAQIDAEEFEKIQEEHVTFGERAKNIASNNMAWAIAIAVALSGGLGFKKKWHKKLGQTRLGKKVKGWFPGGKSEREQLLENTKKLVSAIAEDHKLSDKKFKQIYHALMKKWNALKKINEILEDLGNVNEDFWDQKKYKGDKKIRKRTEELLDNIAKLFKCNKDLGEFDVELITFEGDHVEKLEDFDEENTKVQVWLQKALKFYEENTSKYLLLARNREKIEEIKQKIIRNEKLEEEEHERILYCINLTKKIYELLVELKSYIQKENKILRDHFAPKAEEILMFLKKPVKFLEHVDKKDDAWRKNFHAGIEKLKKFLAKEKNVIGKLLHCRDRRVKVADHILKGTNKDRFNGLEDDEVNWATWQFIDEAEEALTQKLADGEISAEDLEDFFKHVNVKVGGINLTTFSSQLISTGKPIFIKYYNSSLYLVYYYRICGVSPQKIQVTAMSDDKRTVIAPSEEFNWKDLADEIRASALRIHSAGSATI